MPVYICKTCGTSYPASADPPRQCPICEDERQYVPATGQRWLTPAELAQRHVNAWRQLEPDLLELHTEPTFAIGQRALLVRTGAGNVLWDCIALLDEATRTMIGALGGLQAIAISHPHYYTTCQDWARAFGCRVHLHAADRSWLMRPDPAVRFWEGDTFPLAEGMTLVRLGGHFPGGNVLHWAAGGKGGGALLCGDILQVVPRARRVSFMWSYPNLIPLSETVVRGMVDRLSGFRFTHVYGAFPGRNIIGDGEAAVGHSAARYIDLLNDR